MENNSLAIVVYQPNSTTKTPTSPTPPPQIHTPENSLALVVYKEPRTVEPTISTPSTSNKRKERVKAVLRKIEPFSREELPEGLNPDSTYYCGTAMGLPKGWVIEQRPRSNGHLDQYFWTPRTGKQLRSMSQVRKHLENQPADEAETEEIAWDQIIARSKRRKVIQAQPEPFQDNNPPISVSWTFLLKDAGNGVWIPEVQSPERAKEQWTKAFDSLTHNPDSQAAGCGCGCGCVAEEQDNNGGKE